MSTGGKAATGIRSAALSARTISSAPEWAAKSSIDSHRPCREDASEDLYEMARCFNC
jgi:hypothetical protein